MPAKFIDDVSKKEYEVKTIPFTIGRRGTNNAVLSAPSVSRYHAQVTFDSEDNKFFVEDLGSTYGTYINDQKVEMRSELKNGAALRFGSSAAGGEVCTLLFSYDDDPGKIKSAKPADPGKLEIRDVEGCLVARLRGIFRREEIDLLEDALKEGVKKELKNIILNMKNVEAMNSYGLAKILKLGVELQDANRRLKIAEIHGTTKKLFHLAEVSKTCEFFDSEDDALESIKK